MLVVCSATHIFLSAVLKRPSSDVLNHVPGCFSRDVVLLRPGFLGLLLMNLETSHHVSQILQLTDFIVDIVSLFRFFLELFVCLKIRRCVHISLASCFCMKLLSRSKAGFHIAELSKYVF